MNTSSRWTNWWKNDTLIPFDLKEQQKVFGYTQEDLTQMIVPMARMGKDPVGAMGIDAPLPVLSERPQMLYDYFQQNFAQVTNPPIDGVRESIVTSSRRMKKARRRWKCCAPS